MTPSAMPVEGRVAILAVGSELTTGRVADTNGRWAAGRLTRQGWVVALKLAVDDDAAAIGDALAIAAGRAQVVWITGGLGPTRDDITVEAVAAALGLPVVEDARTLRRLEQSWAARGAAMPAAARRMARVPGGAGTVANPVGAAPGIWLETGGRLVLMFPGVPAEMKAIASEEFLPRLARMVAPGTTSVFRVIGLPESEVERRVADLWESAGGDVKFALQIEAGEVILRLAAPAGWAGLADLERKVRDRLAGAVWTGQDESLEEHVVRRLRESSRTVAVAESVTGGLVAARLTSVPGASEAVKGGWVAYRGEAKSGWLGIEEKVAHTGGAVSRECALAMARRAREISGSDVAVSSTGWAGPEGGTPDDPVGTVYTGASWEGGEAAERRVFRGSRAQVREYAATYVLDLLRRVLAGEPSGGSAA